MDARIRYTKRVIKESFISLLSEKSLSKITVTAICAKAGINRATFYKYYDNPNDLLLKLEDQLQTSLQEAILTLPARTLEGVFRTALLHLKQECEVYRVLLSENGDIPFVEQILSLCYQENINVIQSVFPDMEPQKQQWLYYFLGEGSNGLLRRWILTGMQEDVESMVDFIGHIVETINNHL